MQSFSQQTHYSTSGKNKPEWNRQSEYQAQYFQGQASVCSCIAYCDCDKHETIGILFVQNQYGDNSKSQLVLPGGKRDRAGVGRVKHQQIDETCWQTIRGEFHEEVDEQITDYCVKPCPFFETKITKPMCINQELEPSKQQGEYHDRWRGFVGNKPESYYRVVRTYYFKVDCDKIPSKEFGRFRMFETILRTWINLEQIVYEFKYKFSTNKKQMEISPQMYQTIKQFGKILLNQHWRVYKQLEDQKVTQIGDDVGIFKTKLFKLMQLFQLVNVTVNKREYTLFKKREEHNNNEEKKIVLFTVIDTFASEYYQDIELVIVEDILYS